MPSLLSRRIASTAVLFVFMLWGGGPSALHGQPDRPNVILILADDVGDEAFGAYGAEQVATPNIDRLAREGMRFTHAYSQPICTPSRVKIMTGQSNVRNYRAFGILGPDETTFAHVLRRAGYATAVAGKWQLYGSKAEHRAVRKEGMHPDQSGFDRYALWQVRRRPNRFWKPRLRVDGKYRRYGRDRYGPNVTAEFLLDFIETHRDQPFFVYYPTNLPHTPFHWPPGARNQEGDEQAQFRAMVQHLDRLVGRIVSKVDDLGLADETLILFTSDNGSSRRVQVQNDGQTVRGGKGETTEAGMHVPFVARMPGTVPAGAVSDDLVGFSDVLPTLADLADASLPPGPIDGQSFAPQLRGAEGTPRDWLFSFYTIGPYKGGGAAPKRFVWNRDWKLYDDGRLFHLASDPQEQHPIEPGAGRPDAAAARMTLRTALDSMPRDPQALMSPN